MNSEPPQDKSSQSLSILAEIDAACDRFEAEWRAGSRPQIKAYLAKASKPARRGLLPELLCVEIAYRRQQGEVPRASDYQTFASMLDPAMLTSLLASGPKAKSASAASSSVVNAPTGPFKGGSASQGSTVPDRGEAATASPTRRRFGDYELLKELGKGGMGVVYLARQRSADRLVALKLIRLDCLEHLTAKQRQEWLDRFRREGQATARIADERVVTVYEVGARGGRPFYSMRYVEGRSLAAIVKAGALPNRRAAVLMEQVARAVQAVHDQGVLHRDLKPHNILVDAAGRPFITDFGLAKWLDAADGVTHTGDVLGTPEYMSPEQAQDAAHVSAATDVYGLGATLYALLTGRPPFAGQSVAEVLHRVKYREPAAPRRLNSAVSRDLETIVLKCLDKEPGRRYGSAREMADELRRYLDRRPILTRPVGPAGRLWRWCRRKPALASISAAAVFLLTLTGILSLAVSIIARAHEKASQDLDKSNQAVAGFVGFANEVVPQPEQNNQPDQKEVKTDENPPKEQPQPPKNDEPLQKLKQRFGDLKKTEEDKRALDYLNDVRFVHQRIDDGEYAEARELLNKLRGSPYRAWEWHFAAAKLRDAGFPLNGQKGQALAAGRAEGFTIPAGVAGHRREVLAVALSPDGTRLASADAEAIVRIWDLTDKNKKLLRKLTAPSKVTTLAWSPDGKSLAAACQGSLFNGPPAPTPVPPAKAVPPKAKGPPNQGKQPPAIPFVQPRIAGATVIIWDVNATSKRTLKQVADRNPPPGFPSPPSILGPNPSQEQLNADAARQRAEQEAARSRERASVSLIWCPNRKLVFADKDGKLQIWDLTNNLKQTPLSVLPAHDGGVHSAALSPDGKRLATVSFDGVIKIWDLAAAAKKPLVTLQVPPREKFNFDPTYSLLWTKEGKCINVVSDHGEIREVDVEARKVGQPRKLIPRDPIVERAFGGMRGERFRWSPDAKLLVNVHGHEIKIWDAATGKEGVSMPAPGFVPGMPMTGASSAPAWDSSGLRLVIGGSNGAIQAFPVVLRRQAVRSLNFYGPVGWSADSRFLLGIYVYSSAEDEKLNGQRNLREEAIKIVQGDAPLRKPRPAIKFRDSISGEVVRTVGSTTDPTASLPSLLAASPDGNWVASLTSPGLIQVWPLTKGEQAAPILVEKLPAAPAQGVGSQSQPTLLTWSPDSRLLAYNTGTDVQIWDVGHRKKLPSLQREGKPFLRSLAWNPDSERLATASNSAAGKDGTVEVWDVRNRKVVCAFPYFVKYEPHISKVSGSCSSILSWCKDKKRLAVFDDDDKVKVVDVDARQEITTLRGRPSILDVQNSTRTVAWSPDGKRLAYVSQDETIVLCDTITWREALSLRLPKRFSLSPFGIGFGGWLAWSPDGSQLAYFTGGGVLIWDAKLEADAPVQPMPQPANAVRDDESTAAAALEKLGAWIGRDDKQPNKPVVEVRLLGKKQLKDADLKHLKFLTSLQRLYLTDNQVTDAGLENIRNLRSLQILQLSYMQITDAGLKHLKELKNLWVLTLQNTKVTDAGVKDLQNALPKCKIQRY